MASYFTSSIRHRFKTRCIPIFPCRWMPVSW